MSSSPSAAAVGLTTALSPTTFGLLFASTILSTFLCGSTVQWTIDKGLFKKKFWEKSNQYNTLVAIAGLSSMVHTLLCFFNNVMAPNLAFGVAMSVVVNWIVMTNTSIMLVSQRLSLTFPNPTQAWNRLLWINYIAIPCCIIIGTSWAISWNLPNTPGLDKFVLIIEPIQIAIFGLIEFVLSGAFILKMWKYKWTSVERYGIIMLLLVGCCDVVSVLLNLFMGDLQSTCVKGLVYSIRIRLEVNVLCCMVDYIKNRRGTTRVSVSNDGAETERRRTSVTSFFGGSRWSSGVSRTTTRYLRSSIRKSSTTFRKQQEEEGEVDLVEEEESEELRHTSTTRRHSCFLKTDFNNNNEKLQHNNNNNNNNNKSFQVLVDESNNTLPTTRTNPLSESFTAVSQLHNNSTVTPTLEQQQEDDEEEETDATSSEYFTNEFIRQAVMESRRQRSSALLNDDDFGVVVGKDDDTAAEAGTSSSSRDEGDDYYDNNGDDNDTTGSTTTTIIPTNNEEGKDSIHNNNCGCSLVVGSSSSRSSGNNGSPSLNDIESPDVVSSPHNEHEEETTIILPSNNNNNNNNNQHYHQEERL